MQGLGGCSARGSRFMGSGFRVRGSGPRVWVVGFKVQGSGSVAWDSRCMIQGAGCRVQGSGLCFKKRALEFKVMGQGYRV